MLGRRTVSFKPKPYLKLIKKYIFSESEQFPLIMIRAAQCEPDVLTFNSAVAGVFRHLPFAGGGG